MFSNLLKHVFLDVLRGSKKKILSFFWIFLRFFFDLFKFFFAPKNPSFFDDFFFYTNIFYRRYAQNRHTDSQNAFSVRFYMVWKKDFEKKSCLHIFFPRNKKKKVFFFCFFSGFCQRNIRKNCQNWLP